MWFAEATNCNQRNGGWDASATQAHLLGNERQDSAKRGRGLLRACSTNPHLSAQGAPAVAADQERQAEKNSVLQFVITFTQTTTTTQ